MVSRCMARLFQLIFELAFALNRAAIEGRKNFELAVVETQNPTAYCLVVRRRHHF